MDVDLIFKIAAIGILVAVLNQLLIRSGREEQALMTTLAGLVVVLMILVQQISDLFELIRVLEGSLEAAACPGIENDGTCHGSDVCVAKLVWKRINDSITSAVDTLMLGQLIEESRRVHEEKMESQGMEENVPDILK